MASGTGISAQRGLMLAVLVLALTAGGVLWWASAQSRDNGKDVAVAGNVRARSYAVITPALALPVPDFSVGIPSTGAKIGNLPAAGGRSASQSAMSRSPIPVVVGTLDSVDVGQGDRVRAGQVIAQIDTTMLDLGVEAAQAAARKARADVGVVEGNLGTVADNESKLSTARTKLSDGEAQLTKAKRDLLKARKQLRASRAKAVAGRATLKGQIAALEKMLSGPPPPTPPKPPTGPTPTQTLAKLKAKLAELNAGIAKIDAGLAKVDAGLVKVNAGFGKLASNRSKINTGSSALADAKTQLRTAQDVLGVVVEGRDAGVAYARAARDMATITAPVDGVVTYARLPGTVVVVGAPIVRIVPNEPQKVDTYLTAQQMLRVRPGDATSITLDSFPGQTFSGKITTIGSAYTFVPTSFPTDLVHMTRAVKVTVAMDQGAALPAGTPVDVIITTGENR